MAGRRKNAHIIVLDTSQITEDDEVGTPNLADGRATSAYDASLCLSCGEPLAWHEEACGDGAPVGTAGSQVTAASGSGSFRIVSSYAYDIGQTVQPATAKQPYAVVWRGQVKVRHPQTGWLHRVNVYRLNNGHWDCYYEEELQVA